MKKQFILLFCSSYLLAATSQAQIIHVPAMCPTIQQGIDSATSGDTVLVAEGIYYEQIRFRGEKPLIVASEYLLDGNESHIANTIIDAGQAANPDSASVVYFISGEDTTSVLCGFTIQNGKGTLSCNEWTGRQGGGIWIANSSGAKIIHNRITHNILDESEAIFAMSANGGGIGNEGSLADNWVVIGYNTIDSNFCCSTQFQTSGAGISLSNSTRLINNTISYNTCEGQADASAIGGGLCAYGGREIFLIARNNTITNNKSQSALVANSGGVLCEELQVTFCGNMISENSVLSGNYNEYSGGGGMFAMDFYPGSAISNNIFHGNTSNVLGGGLHMKNYYETYDTIPVENNQFLYNEAHFGGAFSTFNVPALLENNVFKANNAIYQGGAVYTRKLSAAPVAHMGLLINNTFSDNLAYTGGAVFTRDDNLLVVNSIFWHDTATASQEIYATSAGSVELAYCDIDFDKVEGPVIDGGNNINTDPQFQDPILLLPYSFSPTVDAGTSSYTCSLGGTMSAPANDITGIHRPAGAGYDMGAYDLQYSGVGVQDVPDEAFVSLSPNPFRSEVVFNYNLDSPAQVTLQVYDNLGIQVAEPVNAFQEVGEHHIHWKSVNLPAGMYYCRLQAYNSLTTCKLLKIQ